MVSIGWVAGAPASCRSVGHRPIDLHRLRDGFLAHCPTRESVDLALEHANGTKDLLFKELNEVFPLIHGLRDTGLRLHTRAKACFLGDSIVRELAATWQRLAPNATMEHMFTACNYLVTDGNEAAFTKPQRAVGRGRVKWLEESGCGVIFVGGLGPHCLRRLPPSAIGPTSLNPLPSSVEAHRQHAAGFLEALRGIALRTAVPVVFVGSPVIEGDVMILEPPKVRQPCHWCRARLREREHMCFGTPSWRRLRNRPPSETPHPSPPPF